jgi:hypothetical protein
LGDKLGRLDSLVKLVVSRLCAEGEHEIIGYIEDGMASMENFYRAIKEEKFYIELIKLRRGF